MGSRSSAPTATRALGRSGASAAEPRPHTCLGGALASGSGVSARLGVMRCQRPGEAPPRLPRACPRGFRATSGRVPVISTLPLGRSKAHGPVSCAARECDFRIPHASTRRVRGRSKPPIDPEQTRHPTSEESPESFTFLSGPTWTTGDEPCLLLVGHGVEVSGSVISSIARGSGAADRSRRSR
jgi:hypothetical protein